MRGLRVTTDETIDAVLKVLAGSVNTQLSAALGAAGARAVGLTGIDSGVAVADQLDPELGFVGRVTSSDPKLLETLTTAGYMPVVACVAGGANGEVYNVNGDSMAVAVASAWKADRLVFLTDVPGVMDGSKSILPTLTINDCKKLIADGVATGGMQAKLDAATNAVSHGVGEVRIVRGSDAEIVTRSVSPWERTPEQGSSNDFRPQTGLHRARNCLEQGHRNPQGLDAGHPCPARPH